MNCPNCQHNISDKLIAKHLAAKGGRAKKHYSEEEKQRRRDRLAIARRKRWDKGEATQ